MNTKTTTSSVSLIFLISFSGLILSSCDSIFGTKGDETTDEVFEEGAIDPELIQDEVGYAALLPFWDDFDEPTDVTIGFDELVYITDSDGLHLYDRAGRAYEFIELNGARAVIQDRDLNVYVSAKKDTFLVEEVEEENNDNGETRMDTIEIQLPAVYRYRNINQENPTLEQEIIFPFADDSRTDAINRARLDTSSAINYEDVEITDLAAFSDNTIFMTRRGPDNRTGEFWAPDNTVLEFDEDSEGNMRNTGQLQMLSPVSPSLASAVGPSAITTFATPPQRDNVNDDLSFLITQADQDVNVPFRVLWIEAEMTPDGVNYRPNEELLATDTTQADRFLYEQDRFQNPTGLTYSGAERNHIFVTDAASDSLYLFQSNGVEGVNPPAGSEATRPINVSFGGEGSGPRNFRNPSGVAYFDQVVYVADTGNDRITRHRLNTDFE